MADLGVYDFRWVRGTTAPLIVSFKINDVPIPYDDVRLSVWKGGVLAFRITLADNEDTAGAQNPGTVKVVSPGTFQFMPMAAQTRSLIKTADGAVGKNSYEIEIRNGEDEEVYLMGTIAAIGGLNDDEDEVS
jgi:hypothetical protein